MFIVITCVMGICLVSNIIGYAETNRSTYSGAFFHSAVYCNLVI